MASLPWPSVLRIASERWNPNKGTSKSGGRSVTNRELIVVGPTGYVTASLTVPVNRPAEVLAMQALLAGLDGRAGTLLVGPRLGARVPWAIDPLTGGRISRCRGDKDAARDPAWDANADTSADLDFRLALAAPLNATTLTIQRNRGGFLIPGMMFSIAGRLHIIIALASPDPAGAGGLPAPGNISVVVRPWLRADHAAGAVLEFARPLCTMQRASDDDAEIELQLSRFGTVSLDLVEAP
ncbi:hypothetical protein [Methylobacterium sp. CM6244]